MSWESVTASVCPIARSLAVIGDRWTLLLLREIAMGVHRFDDLMAQTTMSSHLLTTRLRRMESDGVVERRAYCHRPLRFEYHTTEKGKELDPILMLLRSWGRKWSGDQPPGESAIDLRSRASGTLVNSLADAQQFEGFSFDDYDVELGPTFVRERADREAWHERHGRKSD
ncbi:winged helix-turn-helix transcriptional regulator [Roseateles noduli]|uniref:winged helix-turn-helix transcriptional regulator n=1 Tax=Roseateles noduli TaxID=2052484 RepID=UPI003D65A649